MTLYRLKLGFFNHCLAIASVLGRYALLHKLDLMGYPQRDRVGALLDREIAALGPSVEAYLTHQKTEIEILSARLSRRYDPGAALNEATERAIEAKKTVMACHVVQGEVVPDLFRRVNEKMAAGHALHARIRAAPPGAVIEVTNDESEAYHGTTGNAPLGKELHDAAHFEVPKPIDDFWTREAAHQRKEHENNPAPLQPLTKNQEAALEFQKRSAKAAIEHAGERREDK